MQRAAAGALRTLAFKNEDNKNQIVDCGALPTLIQMLRAEDVGIHYEAVGVIGNLVHSSQHIKRKVRRRLPVHPTCLLQTISVGELHRKPRAWSDTQVCGRQEVAGAPRGCVERRSLPAQRAACPE